MASQYKNITVDGKEIDSKSSLFQVLDNRDSGLPKNIPNVFKCNLARQDGSYKFFKNGLPVVWFAKLEDGSYERLASTESVLYKNANDVFFVDEAFNITGVAYCLYEHVGSRGGIEYLPAKIKELLENDEFTILSGNNFEHANSESKFSILAEEEITSEKVSRGFVGCYNCNDGYPNNLEDCPYCSGRGRFFGTNFGWAPAKTKDYYVYKSVPEELDTYERSRQYFILNDEQLTNDKKKYLASNVWWQSIVDMGDDAVTQLAAEKIDTSMVYSILGQYGASPDVKTSATAKFNIPGGIVNNAVICETCDGRGYIDGIYQKCKTCNGEGFHTSTNGETMWWLNCLHCSDISTLGDKSSITVVRNNHSKLFDNMTDETMPIMRGKRSKYNAKIGYDICDLCEGTGLVNSYNGIKNYKTLSSIKPVFFEYEIDETNITVGGTKRNIFIDTSLSTLYELDASSQTYRSVSLPSENSEYPVSEISVSDVKHYVWNAWDGEHDISNDTVYVRIISYKLATGQSTAITTCSTCNGSCIYTDVNTGTTNLCYTCHGSGKVTDSSKVEPTSEYVLLKDLKFYNAETKKYIDDILAYMYTGRAFNTPKIDYSSIYKSKKENALKNYFETICGTNETYEFGYFSIDKQPMADIYAYMWGNAFYGERVPMSSGFLCNGTFGRAPCPKCFNELYFYNHAIHPDNVGSVSYHDALSRQRALYDEIKTKAKTNGSEFSSKFKASHFYTDEERRENPYPHECGVTAFCDTCNPNGIPETHFKDGLIVNPNSQGAYPEGTETVVGLIDCNTCGNNELEAGEIVCTGCLGIRHWFCTTCSGDGEVEYRPTVAYEDGKKVAVGDGYYYENLFPNATSAFNLYKDYINIKPNDNCDIGRGEYIKKMNLFSVENNGLLTVHNNNYDDVPTSDVKHNLNRDFFAIRDWAKYDSLDERFANLQNCCYAPDAIYFPKRTAHNEEWKLRIRELYYLITDSYIKTNASMLKTNALNQAIADFYTNNTTYLLKLGPIITYSIKGVWRKGAKGSKGVKGVTSGTKGKKGMKGLKGLKGTKGAKGYYEKIVIENKRYKYTLPDILNAIYTEYGQRIMNSGNLGKDDKTYTFYCINEDSENYLWFKGVRIRQLTKGRYQTLNVVKGCKPYGVQRIVYKNNGYNGEYGVMNFQYSRNREFLT